MRQDLKSYLHPFRAAAQVRDGALLAQHFDAKALALERQPEFVTKPIAYDGQFNYAAFGISPPAVVFEEGSGVTTQELVSVDRSGKLLSTIATAVGESATANWLRVAPRGDRAVYSAAEKGGQHKDIWMVQFADGQRTRISLGSTGGDNPIWSPGGDRIAYANSAGNELVVRASNGVGSEQSLLKMDGEIDPTGWSSDGKYILFAFLSAAAHSQWELYVTPVGAAEKPHPVLRNISSASVSLSPDNRWLAFSSDESGRPEVYVIPFQPNASPDTAFNSGRWQISTEGGGQPRWDKTGSELLFANTSLTTLYSAGVKTTAGQFQSEAVHKMFDLGPHATWGFYDPGPNGNIVMFRFVGRQASPLTTLLNWRPKQ